MIVVVLLILAATGALPWFNSGSGGGPRSFSQARSESQPAANAYSGGPWTLGAAVAAVPGATMSIPFNATVGTNTSLTSGCSLTQLAKGNLTIAGSQNISGGSSNEWVFLFKNTAGSALFVSDNDGKVQLVGTLSGSVCGSAFSALNPIPSTVTDSTTAAATVGAAGGYAFLRAHPQANATIEAIGGISFFGINVPAQWLFVYSTCAINLGGATTAGVGGAEFTANVSLVTGQLLGTQTASCGGSPVSGPTPLGSELVLAPPAEASAGPSYWYNFSVQAASNGLPFAGISLGFQTSTGAPVTLAAASIMVINPSGITIATYSVATNVWTSGGSGIIQTGDQLVVRTTTNLAGMGDRMTVYGVGPYASGSIGVSIP